MKYWTCRTRLTLAWTWYLLSEHPSVEERLHTEICGWAPRLADLPTLRYTQQVVKETMRLYPPVYAFGRDAVRDTEVGEHRIKAGDSVIIAPWVLHRDERFFAESQEFRPERWTPAFERNLPKFAYCPFGGGARMCLGKGFAMTEAVLILAHARPALPATPRAQSPGRALAHLHPAVTTRPADGAAMTLLARQHPEGYWEGEMVWNTMLLSQYLLTHRMLESAALSEEDFQAARRHYECTRLPDGSWPFHRDGTGSPYVTTLAYVALRVVGTPAGDPMLFATRRWLHEQSGGVVTIPTWGRMWLAMLGLYDYAGINPLVPELMLLPRWLPVHPERMYCHTRYTYLGLSCLYGRRFQVDLGPLADELRCELYGDEPVDFAAYRHTIAEMDLFQRPARVVRLGYDLLTRYERRPSRRLRTAALRRCVARIEEEQKASAGQGFHRSTDCSPAWCSARTR